MITVFGEGRGFRVVWLLEEMGIPYRLRPVDLLAGVEEDTEFLAINPAGFIPAIQDGEVTMVESIAIMEYRYFGDLRSGVGSEGRWCHAQRGGAVPYGVGREGGGSMRPWY